jgi:hypothetical protein
LGFDDDAAEARSVALPPGKVIYTPTLLSLLPFFSGYMDILNI